MWRRTAQPGLWFTAGAFSQARIYSRFIALQIDAIEKGKLGKLVSGGSEFLGGVSAVASTTSVRDDREAPLRKAAGRTVRANL
jgi:hypothetical protein